MQYGFFLTWSEIQVTTLSLRTFKLAKYSLSFVIVSSVALDLANVKLVNGLAAFVSESGCLPNDKLPNTLLELVLAAPNPAKPAKVFLAPCNKS